MKLEIDEETSRTGDNSHSMLKTEPGIGLMEEKQDENVDLEMSIEKDGIVNKDDFFGKTVAKSSKRKFGNTCTMCYNKEGDPLIMIGPHCIYLY